MRAKAQEVRMRKIFAQDFGNDKYSIVLLRDHLEKRIIRLAQLEGDPDVVSLVEAFVVLREARDILTEDESRSLHEIWAELVDKSCSSGIRYESDIPMLISEVHRMTYVLDARFERHMRIKGSQVLA